MLLLNVTEGIHRIGLLRMNLKIFGWGWVGDESLFTNNWDIVENNSATIKFYI